MCKRYVLDCGCDMDSNTPVRFPGFEHPTSNFYRLPNDWFDMWYQVRGWSKKGGVKIPKINGLLQTMEYIIKYTWGYLNFDKPVKLTYDELKEGRRKRSKRLRGRGDRMDSGTGLSDNAVSYAIKQLTNMGLITLKVDDSDKARVKHWYIPRLREELDDSDGPEVQQSDDSGFTGFQPPEANYFPVPHEWTDIARTLKSAAAILTVEYLMRHTFGWRDPARWLTPMEISSGRRYRENSNKRYDDGIHYTRPVIAAACEDLVERGILVWRTARCDLGREEREYCLRMQDMLFDEETGEWIEHLEKEDAFSKNDGNSIDEDPVLPGETEVLNRENQELARVNQEPTRVNQDLTSEKGEPGSERQMLDGQSQVLIGESEVRSGINTDIIHIDPNVLPQSLQTPSTKTRDQHYVDIDSCSSRSLMNDCQDPNTVSLATRSGRGTRSEPNAHKDKEARPSITQASDRSNVGDIQRRREILAKMGILEPTRTELQNYPWTSHPGYLEDWASYLERNPDIRPGLIITQIRDSISPPDLPPSRTLDDCLTKGIYDFEGDSVAFEELCESSDEPNQLDVLWSEVLEHHKTKMVGNTYDRLLRHSSLLDVVSDGERGSFSHLDGVTVGGETPGGVVFIIGVANKFARDWLVHRFSAQLRQTIIGVLRAENGSLNNYGLDSEINNLTEGNLALNYVVLDSLR